MQSRPESPLSQILSGEFAPSKAPAGFDKAVRVVDWNIDRGLHLRAIINFLTEFQADLVLLQEVDLDARRTHRIDIAHEIAKSLRMNYVFGFEFQELTQGSTASPAYQGQATLSRWALGNPRVIRFARQSDFWRPHWFLPKHQPFQERLGGRIALSVEVQLPRHLHLLQLAFREQGAGLPALCATFGSIARCEETATTRVPVRRGPKLRCGEGNRSSCLEEGRERPET